jgi:hypothetical protein
MAVVINGTTGITSPPTIALEAGTATAAPLDFTAGTNLTTPISGAVEYDGKVLYVTPQGTQRGVVPGAQFFRLDSALAGANVNTVQNIFGVGVTLSASTVYAFEIVAVLSKTAGTTSHNFQIGFGGTATLNNIFWESLSGAFSTAATLSATNMAYATSAAATTIGSGNTATLYAHLRVAGTVSVNAGGTFTPQYTLSAAPGGAYSTQAGSYVLIYPIGASGANVNVGTWA